MRPHRVDGEDRAFEREHVEKRGIGGDLVALGVHSALRQHEARLVGPSLDEMQRAGPVRVLLGAAHGLAVDGDDAADAPGQAPHPHGERCLQLSRVEPCKHPLQGLRRRNPVLERQDAPEPVDQFNAAVRDLVEVLRHNKPTSTVRRISSSR